MIHPLSDVLTTKIGTNTTIWQFCVILHGAVIGSNCNINCNCFVENEVIIGDNVTVKSGVQIWDGVTLENNVFIGPNVTFTNDITPRSKIHISYVPTIVKTGASIGANSTIIAGNTIGEYSLVGAGSVVTKDIPPFTVWYGNPAKHKGYITKSGVLLDNTLRSGDGRQFILLNNEPIIR